MRLPALLLPLALLPLILSAAGCRTAPMETGPVAPVESFPTDAFITERAIFAANGMQFPLNGYVALSRDGGKRLVITESLGQVVADVLVKPDGAVFVMQSSRLFPEQSVRYGVASDLQNIFGGYPWKPVVVQKIAPHHFRIRSGYHTLDLRLLNIQPGPQPADLFDETKAPHS